ncbi:MAG: LptF/LptG family permease [Candidatus Scalinduaceae bacterium]
MVNTLQKYLIKELFRTFIPALVCFEFLILLGFSMQLIHKGLDIPSLVSVMPYMALYSLPHALPSSLLTATVMTYGRLSADNEITAIRIAGVHLHNIITPIIIAGIFFSLLTLFLNAEILPKSYFKVRQLQEKAVKQVLAKHFITAKKKIYFHPYQIYISSVEDGIYKNIAVFEYAEDYITSILLAEEGEIEINDPGNLALLTLRRGEFIKPNTKNKIDVPTMGSFEEATFDIPLRQRVRNTSLKYTTLTKLLSQRKKIDKELRNSKEFFKYPGKIIKDTTKNISLISDKEKEAGKKLELAKLEISNSQKNISKQEKIIKRANFDINIFENYIRVANNNINKIMQEKRREEDNKGHGVFDTIEKKQKREDEYLKKISLIKKIIEKEDRRIRTAKRKIQIAKRLREEGHIKIDRAQLTIEDIKNIKKKLNKEYTILTKRFETARNQNLKRELSLNIHKILSPSFSCLTFILIGIPLGIMTRSNSMLVSLGISFILILFFYYPLVATGLILAENIMFPIIPSLWGANAFNLILGMVLFKNILNK